MHAPRTPRPVILAIAFLLSLRVQAEEPLYEQVSLKEVCSLLLEVAAKIEGKYDAERAEARGLAKRVKSILAMPAPKEMKMQDVRQRLAKEMALLSGGVQLGNFTIGDSWAGYEFDTTAEARKRRQAELRGEKRSGLEEVARGFDSWEVALDLGEKEYAARLLQELLETCRKLIAVQPQDAEAHARLADALQLSGSDLAGAVITARKALELDARNVRARIVVLKDKCLRWLSEKGDLSDATDPGTAFFQRLMSRRFTPESCAVFLARKDALMQELDVLIADAASDLPLFLRSNGIRKTTAIRAAQAELMQTEAGKKQGQRGFLEQQMSSSSLLATEEAMRTAMKLAGNNAEALGAILLMRVRECATRMMMSRSDPAVKQPDGKRVATVATMNSTSQNGFKETRHQIVLMMAEGDRAVIEDGLVMLEKIATDAASAGIQAARAYEAEFRMEAIGLMAGRLVLRPLNLLQSLRHDPFRFSMINALHVVNESDFKNPALAWAITEVLLALDPSVAHQQAAAAGAARMKQWDEAEAVLADCLKTKRDDFMLWNQIIVTKLRRYSSDKTIQEVTALYEQAKDVLARHASMTDENRPVFVTNYVLFLCMKGEWDNATKIAQTYLQQEMMPRDQAENLLKTMSEMRQ